MMPICPAVPVGTSPRWGNSAGRDLLQDFPGVEEARRINGGIGAADFEVQMRAGRATGRADFSDRAASRDGVALLDQKGAEMAVAGDQPAVMGDLDHVAVA